VTPPARLNAYFPTWSPDGTKLVYQARQGGVADVGNLYVHDLATGGRTRITDFDLRLPMWWPVTSDVSLDAEHVVYSLPRTADLQATWDVWEVPLVGGDATRLFENAGAPQYLADARIAFLRPSPGDGAPDTFMAADPGGDPDVLVKGAGEGAASPDGTRIAYIKDGILNLLDLASGRSESLVEAERAVWVGDDRLLVVPGPGAQ
jgi:Tol biopolymer transport system component